MTEEIPDSEVQLSGFRIYRHDRLNRQGGGVCFYVQSTLQVKRLDIHHCNLEVLWLEVKLGKKDKLRTGCIYRPPNANLEFWTDLAKFLEIVEGHDIILLGDLNVDALNPSDRNFSHLNSVCSPFSLKNLVQRPTRLCPSTARCIDLILTNSSKLSSADVDHLDFTDHAAVSTYFPLPEQDHRQPCVRYKRSWQLCNGITSLEEAIDKHMGELNASGLDSMWEEWRNKFSSAIDEVAPFTPRLINVKKRRCPWMTPKLLNTIHKQKCLHRQVVRSNYKNPSLLQEHRKLRRRSTNLYRQLRNEYFRSQLALFSHSPRKLWHSLNYIMGRQNQNLSPAARLGDLTRHFKGLLNRPRPDFNIPYGPAPANSLTQFRPVSISQVERLLSNLVSTKAAGPDGISPLELKMASHKIARTLAILFNESLSQGKLPMEFKHGNIYPLLKPGKSDNALPGNYRGISLTCILSKVLETIVQQQITSFLHGTSALSDSQFGFRKGRSCVDLLLSTIDDWLLARDAKKYTAVVFIDLSKAFDNVQHDLLLLKLQALGIGGPVLSWFHCYLKDRYQKVVLHSESSAAFLCTKGVPQGSVLGPLLFNIYVADVHILARKEKVSLPSFADDFTLFCSDSSPEDACNTAGVALNKVASEFTRLGLPLNTEKTVAMLIRPSSRSADIMCNATVALNGKCVPFVSETRLLGVIVDSKLSWSSHVDKVCRKVGSKIGALKRSFHGLTPSSRRRFLLSVIQPDLEYAASAIIPSMSISLQARLTATWRRAVRCTAGAAYQDDVTPLQKELRLTNIQRRWVLQLATAVFRCSSGSAPSSLVGKLSIARHAHHTRGNNRTYRPFRPSTLSGSQCFSFRAPLIWNALPHDVQSSPSLSTFKKSFLNYLESDVHGRILALALHT